MRVYNQYTTLPLAAILEAAALALTGRVCRLKLAPAPSGAMASMMVGMDGTPVIWIHPNMEYPDQLQLLLHECAHVVLHAGKLARVDVEPLAAGSITAHARDYAPTSWRRTEAEADQLANQWAAWATRNRWRVVEQDWRNGDWALPIQKILTIIEYFKDETR